MNQCENVGMQRREAKLDTMLNELTERANRVRRLAETVNRSLYSQRRREEEDKMPVTATAPTPPPQYPVDTVLGGIEQAENILTEACGELERTIDKLSEIIGEAGILF